MCCEGTHHFTISEFVSFKCIWMFALSPQPGFDICCKLRVNLVGSGGTVPYSCRGCKAVTLRWDDSGLSHEWLHTPTPTQKNLPSAYMVRARPSGSDRPGQAIKSLLIPLVFNSSPLLPLPPPLCCTRSWRAGQVMAAPLSVSLFCWFFSPAAVGLLSFHMATVMLHVEAKQGAAQFGWIRRWWDLRLNRRKKVEK